MASSGGLRSTLGAVVRALTGFSGYQEVPAHGEWGPEIDDRVVEKIREALGGQLQPIPETQVRWYLEDLERAQFQADAGNFTLIGRLWRAMKRDGFLKGLLATRTSGLIRLPRQWSGDRAQCDELRKNNGTRPLFDDMCPPSELSLVTADGIGPGYSIGELVPIPGRDFPMLVRLDPEFLIYRWDRNQWFFQSIAGLLPVEPGLGRWVLHLPGGRIAPWNSGSWAALGRSYINKDHAIFRRANYSSKLANPARVAHTPLASTDSQTQKWFQKVMAWGTNTVFAAPAGYAVSLLESNGRGWEVFQSEIDTSDREYMVCLVGQVVSTTGGTGFSAQELPMQSLSELHGETGTAVAFTINTQIIPPWIANRYGAQKIQGGATLRYKTEKPKDLKAVAEGLKALGEALTVLVPLLEKYGREIDLNTMAEDYALPLVAIQSDGTDPVEDAAPISKETIDVEAEPPTAELEEARARATKGELMDPKDIVRAFARFDEGRTA